jgi:hypothetical protein
MKPEERQAIDRANATKTANGNGKKASGSTQQPNEKKSVNTKSGAQQIQEQLAPAREAVANFTIETVLGGVPLGLQRLSSGDFGEAGEKVFDFIADFNGSLGALTADAGFQLAAGDDDENEPKKMLSAEQDIAIAATVVS